MFIRQIFAIAAVVTLATSAMGQETKVNFGAGPSDPDAPIEVSAESLAINQEDGTAEYRGDVVISQGDMRLSAPVIRIVYDEDAGEIDRMEATGGVTLVSAEDAAEAAEAVYFVRDGTLQLTGNVLLSQGLNVLSSNEMQLDLENGTARIMGRVRTVLNPERNN